jgi:hypothetical protein
MVLGMSLSAYTQLHVIICLLAIASGVVVLLGMLAAKRMDALTGFFLVTTVLSSVTGFLFPWKGVTPGIVIGIISMVVLIVAIYARYGAHLGGFWRGTYVITAAIALYLNCFILIVQSFEKVPALHALAPTQTDGPFKAAQGALLLLFVIATIFAVKKFRPASVYAS